MSNNPFEYDEENDEVEEWGQILYCALGFKNVILSNHSNIQLGMELENVITEVITIFEIDVQDQISKKYSTLNINAIKDEEGVFALCITDQIFPLGESLYFLRTLKQQFAQQYSITKMETTKKYGISSFNREIKNKIEYFNNYDNHRLTKIKRDQEETQAILQEDIDKLLERGDYLEEIVDETTHLVYQTDDYKEEAEEVKKQHRCRGLKMWLILLIALFAVIAVFGVWGVCGLQFQRCFGY